MKVLIKSVWEYTPTSGESNGRVWQSTRQNIDGMANGQKIRISAFGREDMSHLKGKEVDITGYTEKPAYNGTPQYQLNAKSVVTELTPYPAQSIPQLPAQFHPFQGDVDNRSKTHYGTVPGLTTPNHYPSMKDPMLERINRFMTIYSQVNISLVEMNSDMSEDNRVKLAIHLSIEENKRK